jgi:hypothetical protein
MPGSKAVTLSPSCLDITVQIAPGRFMGSHLPLNRRRPRPPTVE